MGVRGLSCALGAGTRIPSNSTPIGVAPTACRPRWSATADRKRTTRPLAPKHTGPLKDVAVDPATSGDDRARVDGPSTIPYKRSDGPNAAIDAFGYTDGW